MCTATDSGPRTRDSTKENNMSKKKTAEQQMQKMLALLASGVPLEKKWLGPPIMRWVLRPKRT